MDARKKERPIVKYKQVGPADLVAEPDKPDWVMLLHNLERAITHYNYADQFTPNSNTYDPLGRYNCGRCNQEDDGYCMLIDLVGMIDQQAGSCEDWESQRVNDPETPLKQKPWKLANYGISADGKGFGCFPDDGRPKCPYASKAKNVDPMGREYWCGKHVIYIDEHACCTINGKKTMPLDDEGQLKGAKKPDDDGDADDYKDEDGDNDADWGALDKD
jgi:hypothetical protein